MGPSYRPMYPLTSGKISNSVERYTLTRLYRLFAFFFLRQYVYCDNTEFCIITGSMKSMDINSSIRNYFRVNF